MNDPDNERAFGALLLIGAAALLGPALVTQVSTRVISWCLAHHVVTTAAQSLITIPGTQVGLDGRRLVIVALAAVAFGAAAHLARRRRQENAA